MAEDEIEQLRRAAARNPALLVRLTDVLVAAGRAEEGIGVCRDGLSRRPDDVPLRLALGRALSAAGHLEEAHAALLDAVARQAACGRGGSPVPEMAGEVIIEEVGFPDEVTTRGSLAPDIRAGEQALADEHDEDVLTSRMKVGDLHPDLFAGGAQAAADRPRREGVRAKETNGAVNLDQLAAELLGAAASGGAAARWSEPDVVPEPPVDELGRAWDRRRARAFAWLWVGLVLLAGGMVGGYLWRAQERVKLIAALVEGADARTLEATFEGDLAARDAYTTALRAEPHSRKYFAMVALAQARLAADHGEDTDASSWAMLRRAEREAARHPPEPNVRAERELRQARALLALVRAEPCPPVEPVDGDITARCALQHADVQGARQILMKAIDGPALHPSLRALLTLGWLDLGNGDLDAADADYRRVLSLWPNHARAVVGRALVSLERGESPRVTTPPEKLGATTEAWFHLAAGLAALGRGDDAHAQPELKLASKGIVHDGRLALLYGRARLQQGEVTQAEHAMRVAERLAPNDVDVAVLDAEVAIAKGYEEKVIQALSGGTPTPRRLAVLGRALCLAARYREAATTLDAALARRPGDQTTLMYRALARAHLNDRAAVRELETLARSMSVTTAHYGLGLLAYERRDLTRARAELTHALERDPQAPRAGALLGRVLIELGKPKEALTQLERATLLAPGILAPQAWLGHLYLELGRSREARAQLRKLRDAGKATPDDKLAFAQATIDLGFTGEGEQALAEARQAGAAPGRLARLELVLRSWKGGKEALAAAKALEKERKGPAQSDPELALASAHAWRRGGDLKHAEEDFRIALERDPLHAELGLARLALARNDAPAAETAYRAALQAWSSGLNGVDDQTEARVGLGRALLHRKQIGEAVLALEPCIKDDPTAPEPRYWVARAYLERGDAVAARAQAEKASQLDDQYADAFLLIGDLNKSGDRERARKAYRRYLELAPDGTQAKLARRSLAALK